MDRKSLGFNLGRHSSGLRSLSQTRRTPADDCDDGLQQLLRAITADSEALSDKVRNAVRLLIKRREWTAAVRLVVAVAGHQQADLARQLGVMRSTVARWYTGETQPSDEQMDEYGQRLQEMLAVVPEFNLTPEDAFVS